MKLPPTCKARSAPQRLWTASVTSLLNEAWVWDPEPLSSFSRLKTRLLHISSHGEDELAEEPTAPPEALVGS